MGMKTSAVWADGTFESNTAPLMGPLEDCARRAAELGYDALSLTVNRPGELDAAYVRRVLGEYGLTASGLATGRIYTVDGLGLGLADQERRQAAVDRMLARAEQLGIQVAFEAISRIDSDAYCSLSETAEFIRSFRSPALRLQVDSIHLHTNGETDFYQGLLKAGDLIGQVDISDVDRMAPDGRHFDFPLLIQALKETGFQDYLVFEYRANPPADAAKAGLDYIRALL